MVSVLDPFVIAQNPACKKLWVWSFPKYAPGYNIYIAYVLTQPKFKLPILLRMQNLKEPDTVN